MGPALSLSSSVSLLSFHLFSSLSPTSYRSPVDKNREEIREGFKSRARYEIKSTITTVQNDIIAYFLAHFCPLCLVLLFVS